MCVSARLLRTGLFLGPKGGAQGVDAGPGFDGVFSLWSRGDHAEAIVSVLSASVSCRVQLSLASC